MTTGQVVFAIVSGVLGLAALVWTITWALRQWRMSGPLVTAETGMGHIGEGGELQVWFRSGQKKILKVEDRRGSGSPPEASLPVNATFVRNTGRAAVTVQRAKYVMELGDRDFIFTAGEEGSPYGDVLPSRLEASQEIVLIHEKVHMAPYLSKVMGDHGRDVSAYFLVLELGNGQEVFGDVLPARRNNAPLPPGARIERQQAPNSPWDD